MEKIKIKTGVLLLQLGTPMSPSTSDVRKYLREFLTDSRVIDIPWLPRQLLVQGIIAPIRAPKSARLYREIWQKDGSPLLIYGNKVREKLQDVLGSDYQVELGMRYQIPSIKEALGKLELIKPAKIIIVPLFPQFASSSTGSALEQTLGIISKWEVIPSLKVVSSYYSDPDYINLWIQKGRTFNVDSYDRVMFTFHGIPWRHIRKSGCENNCQAGPSECPAIDIRNHTCYRAQCFANARAVAEGLEIQKDKILISFQSRLGNDPWLTPYTDKELIALAKQGIKNVLVFSMSFSADCLETIYEISEENQHIFQQNGGGKLQLVPSLNDDNGWITYLRKLVEA